MVEGNLQCCAEYGDVAVCLRNGLEELRVNRARQGNTQPLQTISETQGTFMV